MTSTPPPNVLFIAIDDLRPFIGCYGDANAHTPHMDSLAKRGITFTNAMCTAPCCGPSRAAVMTGRFPTQTGLYGFQDWAGRREYASLVTLPEYFRQNGYRTFASGKVHHNSLRVHSYTEEAVAINMSSAHPDPTVMEPRADREWSVNNIAATREAPYHHRPAVSDCINWSGRSLEYVRANPHLLSGPSDDPVMDCQDGVTARFGVDVLRQDHDQPFFLATGFVRPHLPFIAPRKYFDLYPLDSIDLHPVKDDDLADVPWVARRMAWVGDDINVRRTGAQGRARVVQAYYACTSFLDDMIGMVLGELESSRHAENTIVVLWSDHGWHLGEKRSWRKFTLWEESARTPMIIMDPRQSISAGRTTSRPVGLIDLFPTLTELCGLATPSELDGVSLRPLLDDTEANTRALREPELTVNGRGNYSLRDEKYRYTRYFDGGEELYDHQKDPYEWTNLAHAKAFDELRAHYESFLPEESVPTMEPRGFCWWADLDKDDMEQWRTDVWPKWLREAVPPLI